MLWMMLLALVAGTACGATLSYEMHTPEERRNSLRHWAVFVVTAVVVGCCAVFAEQLNRAAPLGNGVKGLALVLMLVCLGLSYFGVTRWRGVARSLSG
jgi:hypothetical protein